MTELNYDRLAGYDTDYPTEPVGGRNPYNRCTRCGITVPEINGKLSNHTEWCEYRQQRELELKIKYDSMKREELIMKAMDTMNDKPKVVIGGLYQHFKGNLYKVMSTTIGDEEIHASCEWDSIFKATHTETGHDLIIYYKDGYYFCEATKDSEPLVLYYNINEALPVGVLPTQRSIKIWARPKSMFVGTKEIEKDVFAPRFKLVYSPRRD